MKHKNIAIFIPNVGCKQRCSFCNQADISGNAKAPTLLEIRGILDTAVASLSTTEEREHTEIAFFGGSFTSIPLNTQEEYLKVASDYVKEYHLHGIRISTRPDAITVDILDMLKEYGVTAIELGAQSMDNEVLLANRRGHVAADVTAAAKLIHSYGISLGLQMMVGLYRSTVEREYLTMEKLLCCNPDTMRIYPTVIIEGTGLATLMKNGVYRPISLKQTIKICARLLLRCHENNVRVIKLGLHASEIIEAKAIGGAYHPAFREICESEIYIMKAYEKLRCLDGTSFEISVAPSCISKMVGQNRKNISHLAELGYTVKVIPDTLLGLYEIAIKEVAACS